MTPIRQLLKSRKSSWQKWRREMDKWKLTVRIYADKERENREHQEKKDARHHV